jgi:hypothetical protein
MEFASPSALQEFLARWLEDHGHTVHRQVSCEADKSVDLLTQAYTIECQPELNPTTLWTAADELQACLPYFPEQKPVIAGLSPEETEETYQTLEQIKKMGIEIWSTDQMPTFLEYYTHLQPDQLFHEEGSPPPPLVNRRSPLAGCFISLGMAAILTVSFWIAYRILDRQQAEIVANSRDGQAWENLHQAVEVWDLETARSYLDILEGSRNNCIAIFAQRFDDSLAQQGPDGFRDINPIKRALNEQSRCELEIRE